MKMPNNSVCRGRPLQTAWFMAGVFVFVFVLSGFLSVVIATLLTGSENGLAQIIMEKGPHKVMRRIMMLLLIPFVPVLLRTAGWQGWRDCGLSLEPTRWIDPNWCRDLLLGGLIGLLSLGSMIMVSWIAGTRTWAPEGIGSGIVASMGGYLFVSLFIGWLEETAVRGILFRSLVRLWTIWPAAFVSSLLFSYGHFLKASRDAYGNTDIWSQTINVLGSSLMNPSRTCEFELRFVNLSLMGLVLCVFVYRTRTIWIAAGTHAGWVWIKKLNRMLTDHVEQVDSSVWIGHRADMTDSLITVGMFFALAMLGLLGLPVRGRIENSDERL